MKKLCTCCNSETEDLYRIGEEYLINQIKKEHPEWVEQDGACHKCIEYYQALDYAVKIL